MMTDTDRAPTPPADALAEIRKRHQDEDAPRWWGGETLITAFLTAHNDRYTLLREVDRLAARVVALGAAWQPIETAPRTGYFMTWHADYELPQIWEALSFHHAISGMQYVAHLVEDARQATHWQPLTAPPVNTKE